MGQAIGRADDGEELQQYAYPEGGTRVRALHSHAIGEFFGDEFRLGNETFPSMTPKTFLFGEVDELHFLSKYPGKVRTSIDL